MNGSVSASLALVLVLAANGPTQAQNTQTEASPKPTLTIMMPASHALRAIAEAAKGAAGFDPTVTGTLHAKNAGDPNGFDQYEPTILIYGVDHCMVAAIDGPPNVYYCLAYRGPSRTEARSEYERLKATMQRTLGNSRRFVEEISSHGAQFATADGTGPRRPRFSLNLATDLPEGVPQTLSIAAVSR